MLVLERQVGLPVVTVLLSLYVVDRLSTWTKVATSLGVGMMIATAYVLPLWWSVLVVGVAGLSVNAFATSRKTMGTFGVALVALGLLFGRTVLVTEWWVFGLQLGLVLCMYWIWSFISWWSWRVGVLGPSARLKQVQKKV